MGIITTEVEIDYHRGGNHYHHVGNYHHGGNDSHRGGNQFPPLAESQGTYAVGCCPASLQWRRQPIFIGVQWRIRDQFKISLKKNKKSEKAVLCGVASGVARL